MYYWIDSNTREIIESVLVSNGWSDQKSENEVGEETGREKRTNLSKMTVPEIDPERRAKWLTSILVWLNYLEIPVSGDSDYLSRPSWNSLERRLGYSERDSNHRSVNQFRVDGSKTYSFAHLRSRGFSRKTTQNVRRKRVAIYRSLGS